MTGLATRLCALLAAVLGCVVPALAGLEEGPRHVGQPDWMSPGIIDLESELETVRANGKTGLMLLFTTQGCTYCAAFIDRSLGDPVLQRRLRDHFTSIGLEIFDDVVMADHQGNDIAIKRFARQQKADMAPTLLFYGPNGDLIFRAVGYQSPQRFGAILDYLISGSHHALTFADYLRAKAEAVQPVDPDYRELRADPLFTRPPYALARKPIAAERPLLVLFEQTACAECRRFHDQVLGSAEVRAMLRNFEVVRLDARDRDTPIQSPDGARTTPAAWFAAEGFSRVPALLFVDEQGEAVLRNDALTERRRMMNMMGLVLEKKYAEGWSYQRYARTKAIERNRRARSGQ